MKDEFIARYKGEDFNREPFPSTLSYDDLFEIIPVYLNVGEAVSAMLRANESRMIPSQYCLDEGLCDLCEREDATVALSALSGAAQHLAAHQERLANYTKSYRKRVSQKGDVSSYVLPPQHEHVLALDRTATIADEMKGEEEKQNTRGKKKQQQQH